MPALQACKLEIEAVLFDMNGTLRRREPHAQTQQAAAARLSRLLKKEIVSQADWDQMASCYRNYANWAQEHETKLSEAEIWTRWILPEYPSEQIAPVASHLTLAWSERKGRVLPQPGAEAVLAALKQRGYRLGIISNSISTLDIPGSLEAFGWQTYFEVVILSSAVRVRKPAPEPFLEAARRMNIAPQHCAYVGNRILRDIAGCKRAGYGLGILIEVPVTQQAVEPQPGPQPDRVIHALGELLDLFPDRLQSRSQASAQPASEIRCQENGDNS
jgi:putative hydrolase of the HAD superfamily